MHTHVQRPYWAAVVLAAVVARSFGQSLEQRFDLEAGWNAVFFEVDPVPDEPDLLFDGQSLSAVWLFAPDLRIQGPPPCPDPDDPACKPESLSPWLQWVPPGDPASFLNALRVVRGGRVYLVFATEATTLTVVGPPNSSKIRWRAGFNLAGFHVVSDPASTPTFRDYLAPSPLHQNLEVFEQETGGGLSAVANLDQRIQPGRGYWVKADADGEYDGPLDVDNGTLTGVNFGQRLGQHPITLRNLAGGARSIELRIESSASPAPAPAGVARADVSSAGPVPLRHLDYGAGSNASEILQWLPLNQEGFLLGPSGEPGSLQTVQVGVSRAGLAEAMIDPENLGSQYESLLVVTDGAGFRRYIPVAAQVSSQAGLWVGSVQVERVQWITADARTLANDDVTAPVLVVNPDGDTVTARPTAIAFVFPILVHLSSTGTYKMLTEVTMLFDPGAGGGAPARFVLATPDLSPTVRTRLEAGSIVDGQPFARRISTLVFAFDDDLVLTGSFAGALDGETTMPADHKLNPFRHKFHPDHGEGVAFTRAFTLTFAAEPPPGVSNPEFGHSFLVGDYTETLTNVHRDPITVTGTFELRRVSPIATLNAE